MNKHPGAYLVTQCKLVGCPFINLRIYVFLGFGRYDIAYAKHCAICGGCRQGIKAIEDIEFLKCRWSFKGLTNQDQEISSPRLDAEKDISYFPMKEQTWKWLVIETYHLNSNSSSDITEIGVQVKLSDNDLKIVDKLTRERNKYKAKYKQLKMLMKSKQFL